MAFRLEQVPPPHSLHSSTLASGRHGYAVSTESGVNALLYYCPMHRASAVFEPAHGYWTIRTPDTFGAFLSRLASLCVTIPDDEDGRDWIEACGLTPCTGAARATH